MRMTLREWGRRGCPGVFTRPDFSCWTETSILLPDETLYRLVITTGKEEHPFFPDRYAIPGHLFSSFDGLTRYLKKRPDEIEGEVE